MRARAGRGALTGWLRRPVRLFGLADDDVVSLAALADVAPGVAKSLQAPSVRVRELVKHLQSIYCHTMSVEYDCMVRRRKRKNQKKREQKSRLVPQLTGPTDGRAESRGERVAGRRDRGHVARRLCARRRRAPLRRAGDAVERL